jgi:protein-disulfide isomerase
MKRLLMLACLVSLALPAWAADPDFTPEQRKAIVQILRDALRSDPSILRDAIGTLQADNQAREESEAKQRIAAKQQALFATPNDPVAGNARGDVTVVEFYDPRCPYCRRMVPAIDAMLRKDHGIRLIYKDIPVLGPASVTESRAILAAQAQGGYLKMQAALMANPEQPNDAMIRSIARQVGLDPDKLVADMNGAAVTAKIAALESAIAAARRRG